jgi:tRNA-dihydrouridine synthase B
VPGERISIGSFQPKGILFLAPVAGYTDRAFRSLCVEFGADLTYTEMVSVEALVRDSAKTLALTEPAENEAEYAVQLFGAKPDSFARAAERIGDRRVSLIDVNCGCPVPKVIKSGAGSALLKSPELVREIASALSGATDVPVTVKIRSGWDSSRINYLETADAAISGGASAITLHARTREQGYAGTANWDHVKTLKDFLVGRGSSVPVFGSGDLFRAADAVSMLARTGCDAVMFARGALGNPFIFRETEALLAGAAETAAYRPSIEEVVEAARRHFELSLEYSGERLTCMEMKKHLCAYFKGFPHAAELRSRIVLARTRADYDCFLRLENEPYNP